tara:strand:- start:364 stop:573 length:210 start_codon:yes stop_codon:yes gene_type:complete
MSTDSGNHSFTTVSIAIPITGFALHLSANLHASPGFRTTASMVPRYLRPLLFPNFVLPTIIGLLHRRPS